jgi:Zn-dependent M16 (insulinase) family peptidase
MAAKGFRIHRIRVDGAYVSAALFAVLGSYTLLGSYADSKPIKTYEVGSYHLNEFVMKQPGTYKLGLKQGLHYCLSPATSSATVSSV